MYHTQRWLDRSQQLHDATAHDPSFQRKASHLGHYVQVTLKPYVALENALKKMADFSIFSSATTKAKKSVATEANGGLDQEKISATLEPKEGDDSDSISDFKALGLSRNLAEQCRAMGLTRPTPVQVACVPAILAGDQFIYSVCSLPCAGKDCCACAKTGSGKTAAFALPILHMLGADPYGIFAVIITPTR